MFTWLRRIFATRSDSAPPKAQPPRPLPLTWRVRGIGDCVVVKVIGRTEVLVQPASLPETDRKVIIGQLRIVSVHDFEDQELLAEVINRLPGGSDDYIWENE